MSDTTIIKEKLSTQRLDQVPFSYFVNIRLFLPYHGVTAAEEPGTFPTKDLSTHGLAVSAFSCRVELPE